MITIASTGLSPSDSGPCFPNMAGCGCNNETIERELLSAGIEVVVGPVRDAEVATNRTGRLGPFTFTRAWYYWVVNGPTPLNVARLLYEHPDGRHDVRVAGNRACPPPDTSARYYDADGALLHSDPDGSEARKWAAIIARNPHLEDGRVRYVPDAAAAAARLVIAMYHIDTQAGLRLFADTITAHGLHEER